MGFRPGSLSLTIRLTPPCHSLIANFRIEEHDPIGSSCSSAGLSRDPNRQFCSAEPSHQLLGNQFDDFAGCWIAETAGLVQ